MTSEKHHLPIGEQSGSASAAGQLSASELHALIEWYLAFRQAAALEHAEVAPAVASMNMDQMAVPVMIPLQAVRLDLHCGARCVKGSQAEYLRCLDLYQALLLGEFTRLTAADPDRPTTNEVALAQIQLAMVSFTTGSFAEMIREVEP